ncbi:MAG: glycosyltransferase family 4 protein [Planctomycetota bacterium]
MMPPPDDTILSEAPPKVDLALCVDPLALRRFRAVLRYLCVGLLDVAAQVRLVTSSAEAQSLTLGSVQHVFYKEVPWPFRGQGVHRVLEALAGRVPNLVHGFTGRSFEMAAAIARHFDVHLVLHALSMNDVTKLARPAGYSADHVVAGSRPIFDAILEGVAVDRQRLSLVRSGTIAGDGPTCFTQPHRIPTILCTSQLTLTSGVDRLLEALCLLRERGQPFLAFLTGSGPAEHALRKAAQAAGLASVVTFAQPLGDAKQIMAGADIFVRPSAENAISVRTLQALGAGMAMVTVQGGAADAYLHEITALVCPDGQPITLAAAIERLLLDRVFARTLATQAVQHVKKYHSVSAMCEALLQIYYDLSLRDKTLSVNR